MYHLIRKILARKQRFNHTREAFPASINNPANSFIASKDKLPVPIGEKPPSYGAFWKENTGGLEWYTWMYNSRLDQHLAFQSWFNFISRLEPVTSVLELGCGLAVGYAEFFEDIHYVGTDISEKEIAWCKNNRTNPKHEYIACDFIKNDFRKVFDVVFSQGTIDNTYDMDGFIEAAVAASKRWIYLTAYRGFFPHLTEHQYSWNEDHGCYYNDISPIKAYQVLQSCGCTDIAVIPSYTGRENVKCETLLIARVD